MFLLIFNFQFLVNQVFTLRGWILLPLEKCKTKAIQANLTIFTHIPTFRHIHSYSGIIKHIQELFEHIQSCSEPCITLVYFESQHIQNQKHIRTVLYSEPRNIQNPVKHLRQSVLQTQLTTIMIFAISAFYFLFFVKKKCFFNTCLIFTPEVFILCKKERGPRGPETVNF